MSIHKYLGKLGRMLPELTEWEWNNIFQFVDFFNSIEVEGGRISIPDINWTKVKEILEIIGKVKK